MPRKDHSYEDISHDLALWIEATAQRVAGAMMEGDAAPGGAVLTKDEQLDFYHGQLYTPDGQPNVPGRQAFLARLGPAEQQKVTDALLRRHRDRLEEAMNG